MKSKGLANKKIWSTPKLTVYGDVEKITSELPGTPSHPS